MNYGEQPISIKALTRKGWLDTEMRVVVNESKVKQYAEEKAEGAKFPAPVCFLDKKEQLHVGDGFHRILADKENGHKTINVDIRRGEKSDAILFNIEANRKQIGLPFTRGDKKKCILTMLSISPFNTWAQTRIANTVGCSSAYVSHISRTEGPTRPELVETFSGIMTPSTRIRQGTFDQAERRLKIESLLLRGKSHREIAQAIGQSIYTVRNDVNYLRSAVGSVVKCPHCNGTGWRSNLQSAP